MNYRLVGFSLAQILLSLTIMTSVFLFTTIHFDEVIQRHKDRLKLKSTQEIISFAQAFATIQTITLKLCKGSQNGCDSTQNDILLWADLNEDNKINASERIVKTHALGHFTIRTNRAFFLFKDDGQIWPNGSITLCPKNSSSPSMKFTLIYTGKIRYIVDENNAILC